jgi:hypothetical protein
MPYFWEEGTSMSAIDDVESIMDTLDTIPVSLSRTEFEQRFRTDRLSASMPQVSEQQMTRFYEIAVEYLRSEKATPGAKDSERRIRQLVKCYRTIVELQERLKWFTGRGYAKTLGTGPWSSALDIDINQSGFLLACDPLESLLARAWERVRIEISALRMLRRKALLYEFMLDLNDFVRSEFGELRNRDRLSLITRAMIAARVFPESKVKSDRLNRSLVNYVSKRREEAIKYYQKAYVAKDIIRVSGARLAKQPDSPSPNPENAGSTSLN